MELSHNRHTRCTNRPVILVSGSYLPAAQKRAQKPSTESQSRLRKSRYHKASVVPFLSFSSFSFVSPPVAAQREVRRAPPLLNHHFRFNHFRMCVAYTPEALPNKPICLSGNGSRIRQNSRRYAPGLFSRRAARTPAGWVRQFVLIVDGFRRHAEYLVEVLILHPVVVRFD